ncbi:MAG: TetR/AcrR family transcriptional regulator [Gemmatimonadaceae bacterium]
MRYPEQHKQETRERIVRAAARRFRGRGAEGVVIADIMQALRLTHGGFYRHFHSKEALFAEAVSDALQRFSDRLTAVAQKAPPGGELKALIDAYLSVEHCNDTANGCPVAALASELARQRGPARSAFRRAVQRHVTQVARFFPGPTPQARQRHAVIVLTGMAGTLSVARAVANGPGRRRLLNAARIFYLNAARL